MELELRKLVEAQQNVLNLLLQRPQNRELLQAGLQIANHQLQQQDSQMEPHGNTEKTQLKPIQTLTPLPSLLQPPQKPPQQQRLSQNTSWQTTSKQRTRRRNKTRRGTRGGKKAQFKKLVDAVTACADMTRIDHSKGKNNYKRNNRNVEYGHPLYTRRVYGQNKKQTYHKNIKFGSDVFDENMNRHNRSSNSGNPFNSNSNQPHTGSNQNNS